MIERVEVQKGRTGIPGKLPIHAIEPLYKTIFNDQGLTLATYIDVGGPMLVTSGLSVSEGENAEPILMLDANEAKLRG